MVDQYMYSAVVAAQRAKLDQLAASGVVPRKFYVTFVKDRTADVEMGRFVDTELGALGYEWPHVLAVAESTLGVQLALRIGRRTEPRSVAAWRSSNDLIHSVRLEVGLKGLSGALFTSVTGRADSRAPAWLSAQALTQLDSDRERTCGVLMSDGSVVVGCQAPGGSGEGAARGRVLHFAAGGIVLDESEFVDRPMDAQIQAFVSERVMPMDGSLERLLSIHRLAQVIEDAEPRTRVPA